MRVLAAGLRAVLINRTGIVGFQKRAGELLENPIPIFVEPQVIRFEINGFLTQAPCHAVLVALGPQRPRSLAAVGAREAIGFGKHFIVQRMHHGIEVAGRLSLNALQKGYGTLLHSARSFSMNAVVS
jgi:hypothetical protein